MIPFLISFGLGISSKFSDLCSEHGWKPFPYAGYFFGFLSGAAILYLVLTSTAPVVTLIFAIVAGLILSGKIDAPNHYLAILIALLALPLIGFPKIDYPLFLLFTAVCVLEEKINDYTPKLRKKHKLLSQIIDLRPLLEIATLAVSLFIQDLSLWFMLFCYDVGYLSTCGVQRNGKALILR